MKARRFQERQLFRGLVDKESVYFKKLEVCGASLVCHIILGEDDSTSGG